MTLIDRYLAKSIAVPLLGTLILAAMLLVLDKMLRLFDFVVNAGGPVSVVWRMLANLLPEYFALGIPIGLLLGILLAFRKLALSSELDALRGIGVGYGRLLRIPYTYAFGLMALNLLIVGYLQPLRPLPLRGASLRPALGRARRFDQGRRVQPAGQEADAEDRPERGLRHPAAGHFRPGRRHGGRKRRRHRRGRALPRHRRRRDHPVPAAQWPPGPAVARNSRRRARSPSRTYDLPIPVPAIDSFRRRGIDYEELYLDELFRQGYGGAAANREDMLGAQANLHFRLVEVFMMLMLPMLAVALAVPPKRSSSSLGIFVGIVMVVAYHKVNQYGEQAGAQGRIDPIIALWGPFLLLVLLIGWMYHVIAHRPGGQPIGTLEWAAARTARWVRSLLPKAKRA